MPWVPKSQARQGPTFSMSAMIQLLLMGYGFYCMASNIGSFIKSIVSGRKELPKHVD